MGGRGSCRVKFSASREVGNSARENMGLTRGSPSQTDLTPNKFGAQEIRHQPLAKASGMNG